MAERILIAAECVGDAKWFIDKARPRYAKERVLFERPIGQNPGCAVPDRAAPMRKCAAPN